MLRQGLLAVSLAVNVSAVGLVLLYWAVLVGRRCTGSRMWHGDATSATRRQVANFIYLWASNAAGAAELALVNSFLGAPTAGAVDQLS